MTQGGAVAHNILVTANKGQFLFPFFDLDWTWAWAWTVTWPRLVNTQKTKIDTSEDKDFS